MSEQALHHIQEAIEEAHTGDKAQLEAIFSDAERLIIEAPAGCGKTKSMISKIAYILASARLVNPKKILALTFSVNAAYKIKRDVSEQLPRLLQLNEFNPAKINERVFVSNYHGFCRHVLRLYGYLIHDNLRNVDKIRSIDDSSIETMTGLGVGLSFEEAKELSDLCDAIKDVREDYVSEYYEAYLVKVKSYLLPNGYITYNSIILFTLYLLDNHPNILKFYHRYFPIVIVDEFQDTNIISYSLLSRLVSEDTRAVFIGDPLQRIYGFIGAVPNLMERAKEKFGMQEIRFKDNWRFKGNPKMLMLDKNIRLNAENPTKPDILENASVDLAVLENQAEEAEWVVGKIQSIIEEDESVKIAVLVRARSSNADRVIENLDNSGIDYFYGLYTDEDVPYLNFHRQSFNIFTSHIRGNDRITKANLQKFYGKVQESFKEDDTLTTSSLLELLAIFLDRLVSSYSFLTNEDKIIFILDTLENRALKQQMEYVSKKVTITTIHGAKGLEWDCVILPDMEQYGFPTYRSLCGSCDYKHRTIENGFCKIGPNHRLKQQYLDELSVFYVSATRAKKNVYFSSSRRRIHYSGEERETYVSCLLSLPGIQAGNPM